MNIKDKNMKFPLNFNLLSIFFVCLPLSMAASANALEETLRENAPKNICNTAFRIIGNGEGGAEVFKNPNYYADDRGAEVIKLVPAGTEVLFQISDRTGDWSEISLKGGLTGWVRTRDLRVSFDESSTFNGTMRVKTLDGSNLNIRQSASLSSPIISFLRTGAIVTYKGSVGYWTEVVDANGVRGFVSSKFLVCSDAKVN